MKMPFLLISPKIVPKIQLIKKGGCFEYHAVIADKIKYRYVHRASICPALGMDRRSFFMPKPMGKYKRLEVFYLSKPVYTADKPSDCHYCYFWTNGRKLFNNRTNVDIQNRLVCFDIKELGNQLKKIGMLIVQDQVWGRVTANRSAGKSTRYYIDEFHLLLKEEQTATYSVEIWKRFRKWGGLPTGITQNVKDLLRSPEIANILENSDFIYMLNQASDDRSILAQRLNISPHQLSYVTNSGEGEGLLFYGNVILPFIDRFPTDLELYRIMTTKLNEVAQEKEA